MGRTDFSKLVVFFGIGMLIFGCTRPGATDATSVSMSFPAKKNSSLSSSKVSQGVSAQSNNIADLVHLVLNVQTPEKGLQVCTWDKNGSSSGPCVFDGTNVSLDIPSGSGRLFQALLVYQDATGVLTFEYGDTTVALSGTNQAVGLSVSAWGDPSTARARIMGRYLKADGTSPSGHLQIRVRPSSSKPSMVLEESEMFNGWFNGMAISGVGFEYWVAGDSNPLSFMTSKSTPTVKTSMSYEDFYAISVDNTTQVKKSGNSPEYEIKGFFSADTTSGNSTFASTQALVSGSCSTANMITCMLTGGTSPSSFRGPFKGSSGSYITASSNLQWNYINGVTGAQIDGVYVFRINNLTPAIAETLRLNNDSWNCDMISHVGVQVATVNYTDSPNNSIPVPSSPALGQTDGLFFCPIKSGTLISAALAYPEYLNNLGGQSNGPYLRLEGLYNFQQNGVNLKPLTLNQCVPVSLKTYQAGAGTATPFALINSLTVTLPASSDVAFYPNSNCTSASTSSVQISAGSSTNTGSLSMKVVNSALTSYQFNLSLSTSEIGYNPDVAFNIGKPVLKYNLPSALSASTCYPVKALMFAADGVTPMSTSATINIDATSLGANSVLYDTVGCTGSTPTSVSFSSSNVSNTFYLNTGTTPAGSLGFSGASSYSSSGSTVTAMPAGQGQVATKLGVAITGSLIANQCSKIKISLQTEGGYDLPIANTTSVKITAPGVAGAFFGNPDCSGSAMSGDFSLNAGDFAGFVYFMPFQTSANAQITANAGAGLTNTVSAAVLAPSTSMSIYPTNLPDFHGSQYVGSHEFTANTGTSLLINFAVPAGSQIYCTKDDTPMTDCSSLVSGSTFEWPLSEASTNTGSNIVGYWLRASVAGQNASFYFKPGNVYGSNFQVKTCASVITPQSLDSFSFVSGSPTGVNCLASGSYTLTVQKNLPGYEIIGKSDLSSVLNLTAAGELYAGGSAASNIVVANLTINDTSTSTSRGAIRSYNLTPAGLAISHIAINMTLSSSFNLSGIKMQGTSGVLSVDNVTITTSSTNGGSSNYGIYMDSDSGTSNTISNVSITNTSGTAFDAIYIAGSTAASQLVSLKDYSFSGVGAGLRMYGPGSSYSASIGTASRLKILSQDSSGKDAIMLDSYGSLTMQDSFIKNLSQYHIRLNDVHSTISLSRNVFQAPGDAYSIVDFGSPLSEFVGNQFVRTGGTTGTYALYATASSAINSTDPTSNLFCSNSTSAGSAWLAPTLGTLTGTGSTAIIALSPLSGTTSVSASNRCTGL